MTFTHQVIPSTYWQICTPGFVSNFVLMQSMLGSNTRASGIGKNYASKLFQDLAKNDLAYSYIRDLFNLGWNGNEHTSRY
jgi:hypothetical protein